MKDAGRKVPLRRRASLIIWVLMIELCAVCVPSEGHYVRVSSRWLVRESDGVRTKLACVNWAGHLETLLPEGLNRQPLYRLGLAVKGMGFNCVRLTFATYMFTDRTLSSLTVTDSFTRLNLTHSLRGIAIHNPDILHLPIQVAFARVVARLTRAGLLIILDNHVSKPQWCCDNKDGNGFWGDSFFNADAWLRGLTAMAALFKDNTEVVGISLRNELRGPKQNIQDWHKYMSAGANAVHDANPNLVIIVSGLRSDTDLRFAAKNPISDRVLQDKLVYEMHWYASSYGTNFGKGNLNKACAIATSSIMKGGAYMTSAAASNGSFTAPLFISEFGIDQRGSNRGHNRFINCFFAFMTSMDLDWAYWPLQGNYYLRHGQEGDEEFFGILNSQWNAPRNISLLARLQALQQPWQSGVENNNSRREYQVLFHPATGLCVQKGRGNALLLGTCTGSGTTHWRYTAQGRLEVEGSYLCIGSGGEGQFATLQTVGTEKNGPWTLASVAKLQFATSLNHSHPLDLSHSHPIIHDHPSHDPNSPPKHLHHHHHTFSLEQDDDPTYFNDNVNHSDDTDFNVNVNYSDEDVYNVNYSESDADNNGNVHFAIHDQLRHANDAHNNDLIATPLPISHNPLLCLDGSTPPSITTTRCICVQVDEMDCGKDDDPSSQWFVLISSNIHPTTMVYTVASES